MFSVSTKKEKPDEKYFGHFRCHQCDNDWKSAWTFYNSNKKVSYRQKCRRCRASVEPFKLEEIKCSKCSRPKRICRCKKHKPEDSRKPHKRHLCEKCQLDGIPCILSESVLGHSVGREEQEMSDEYDDESDDEEDDKTDDWSSDSVQSHWTDRISSSKRTKTNLWLDFTGEKTWTDCEYDSESDEETVDENYEATDRTESRSMQSTRNQWTGTNRRSQWTYGWIVQADDDHDWNTEDTDEEAMFTGF